LEKYIAYLSDIPGEMEKLLDVVTIHITGFFRDQDVFASLTERIVPAIVERKLSTKRESVRIWSAGCSTGEEAYSIAILFAEILRIKKADLRVEIFGTDISEESCRVASKGVYPERRLRGVSQSRKRSHFDRDGECYRISADIRRCVKFMVHDLFDSPPFSMLDLVICRNVLIHFNQKVREDIISGFHSALGENGILILGKSEALTGSSTALFRLVDPRTKIYRKRSLGVHEGGK
jgi:two-component system CheB/CheR fusion protein